MMQIRYSMYFNSSGYSICAQDYNLAIKKNNPETDIKVFAINGLKQNKGVSKKRYDIFYQMSKTQPKSNFISVQHCIPNMYISDNAKKRIGFAIYETIDPPSSWVHKMNEMDYIITASQFNKNSFETAGVIKPISVIPHCFDTELFNKDVVPDGRYNLFTFMYIASWRERKNFPTLIKSFYDAFSTKDKVCLILKTDKPEGLKRTVNSIKNENWKTKDTAPIYIDGEIIPFEEIPKFMKKADVYISTSVGEGFNLGGLHAMALNIPLITVRYGGGLEYAKQDLCTYINPHGYKKHLQMDGLSQFKNKIWAELTMSEVKEKMLYAYNSYSELKEISEKAYIYSHINYNYDIIGERLLSLLKEAEDAI